MSGSNNPINDVNPFDGNNGKGVTGWWQDSSSRMFDPLGVGYGDAIYGDSVNGGGIPGMLGIGGGKKPPGGGSDMAAAYQAQAAATVKAADIAANASRDVANAQLAGMQAQADASIKNAQMGTMGGIIGAALGAHTTTEQIKRLTPVESGANTIASWDLAQKWNKTLKMRVAGYQDAAINYELSGKHWSTAFSDPQFNQLKMMELTKRDMLASAQTFGLKSASNPTGIDMSEDVFMNLMRFKDPMEMMQVDPQVAAARNAQFDAWQKSMKDQGLDLVAEIVKNPQLAGGSILSMKGKDPLIDPAMGEFMGAMMQGQAPGAGNSSEYDAFIKDPSRTRFTMVWDADQKKHIYVDSTTGAEVPKATYDRWAQVEQQKRNQAMSSNSTALKNEKANYEQQKGVWDKAIAALTKGEQNEYTDQIKTLIEKGVIDAKTGEVNAGALQSFIPPELMEAPQFNPYREIDPNTEARYRDQYRALTEITVDPKLVREETLGNGMIRKTKLNADGSVATQAIEGYMTDMMGNNHFVSMQGRGMQDWNNRQMMLSGNPFRPGMRAATNVNAYMQEVMGPMGQMGPTNKMAQANTGQAKGQQNVSKPNTAVSSNPYGSQSNLKNPKAPKSISAGSQPSTPAGYDGAPLASGGTDG